MSEKKPRKRKGVTVKLELHQWVEEQIEKGRFRCFSHAVEVALMKLKLKEETLCGREAGPD
jgi:Arc/MetJ-type ribon-helix-helix transcriptional regulator